MDRLQAQDEARKDKLAVNKEEQEVNDYRRDINAAHQQQQKERNNRRKTRESQQADMAQRSAKDEKKRQRAQNFVLSQQQSYMEKVENNIEKQYMDQLRNQKIADKNANFMDKTAKMFNDRKAAEAEEKEELDRQLHECREANLERLREEAAQRGAIKQENLRLEEKREKNNEKVYYDRHRRELLRAQQIQQEQKEENEKTGTVPMRIVLAKNQFLNLPFQTVLQHVVHEQKELDILKSIDFELLKGSDGQKEDEQIFRTCTRLLSEAQEHKLSIPDCSLAAFQSF